MRGDSQARATPGERISLGVLLLGVPPIFLEAVGAKHQMRSRRLTPSRKVGQRTLPLSARDAK